MYDRGTPPLPPPLLLSFLPEGDATLRGPRHVVQKEFSCSSHFLCRGAIIYMFGTAALIG
ncbi:hypothetical protein E2C01_085246 [Portunus trituberculatus]|uniref:Uncharacterized protein n=1 Tax=Portunus trituberculatus TaxID=210409 RepID=A0A5B7J684_PORTR|nr:hypothetical protein [Portunus trituberculatus]